MKRLIGILIITLLILAMGCSGDADLPTSPQDVTARETTSAPSHQLWGMYQFAADPEAGTLDFVPLRAVEMHVNVLPFLEPPPLVHLTLESLQFNGNIIETDIGLRHPFLGLVEFSGFDVCGILISQGSIGGYADSDLLLPGPDDLHLVNYDGLTRWWNPAEFPHGTGIFGYVDGLLGSPDSFADFSATLNGYKYFCDDLVNPDDPLTDVDPSGRGMFSPGQKNVRHFTIDMGTTGLIFNYAIDACWQFPTGPPPWEAPADFAEGANRPEAWNIVITEVENTLYNDTVENGGDLSLSIDVYDWYHADMNNVIFESPGSFPAASSATATGGGVGYSTYEIDIVGATPAETEIELFITVECEAVGYGNAIPDVTQAAYFTSSALVDDEAPVVDEWPEEWSGFQYNSYNLGTNPNLQEFDPTNYTEIWYTADLGLKYTGPAITETHVYTCANLAFYSDASHHITAFNISDGLIAWQHYINTTGDGGRAHTSPYYYDDGADGRIIVGGDRLYCFNAVDGSTIWEYGPEWEFTRHSPKVYNDRVFIAGNGRMHCVDISDGSLIWVSDTGMTSFETVPGVRDGYVYFGGSSQLYGCMDADSDTADVIWQVNHGGMTTHWNGPFITEDRLYYAASYDQRLLCLDITDGSLKWVFEDPDPGTSSVWLTALANWIDPVDEKRVVCWAEAYSTGRVRAVKDQDAFGELVWQYPPSSTMYFDASPVYCEGRVYVGTTSDDAVHVLDSTTGNLITKINLNGDVRGAVGFAYGRMVATTTNGVYCFE